MVQIIIVSLQPYPFGQSLVYFLAFLTRSISFQFVFYRMDNDARYHRFTLLTTTYEDFSNHEEGKQDVRESLPGNIYTWIIQ